MITTPIKNKSNINNKELAILLVMDIIMLMSLISLLIIGALIEPRLILSAIVLLLINFTYFYSRFLYKYFLLIFLLLALFGIFNLSYFNIYVGNEFFSIELISFIFLVWFIKINGNFVFAIKSKNFGSQLDKSFFKQKFHNLSKEELLDKLADKQHLTQEAVRVLEELLKEKN